MADYQEIKVLRTQEIDSHTWEQISNGYKVCFDIDRDPDELKESFSRSITGFTLHALKFDTAGNLMGHNYYQPRPYILNGKEIICALSGGTFVLPEYRHDIFIFNELVKALDKESARLGWKALLGVPNENSFKYAVKINKQKHIGNLNYYMLPIHASKIIGRSSRLIDGLSSVYASCTTTVGKFFSTIVNLKERIKPLRLNTTDEFLDIRFDWNKYTLLKKNGLQGVYRVYDEHGIRTAYITYFGENHLKSARALAYVVSVILKRENVDAIMYIGTMNFPQSILTKVPKRFWPQQLPLCVTVLDKKDTEIKEMCSTIDNIDFGLINFDVR